MDHLRDESFSQRPHYDPAVFDEVIALYCTFPTPVEKKPLVTAKAGIDVSKRRAAILRSLRNDKVHTFGELELGLFNNNS